jgi:hypothetical protein
MRPIYDPVRGASGPPATTWYGTVRDAKTGCQWLIMFLYVAGCDTSPATGSSGPRAGCEALHTCGRTPSAPPTLGPAQKMLLAANAAGL